MRRLLYLLPLAAFFALAGYFALALRPNHDPHELPSAMINKPAPTFDLRDWTPPSRSASPACAARWR